MEERRSKLAGRWATLLPIALLALAFQTGGTIVAAQAGAFPPFIQISDGSARGVAVDKVGNVYVSVGVVDPASNLNYIQLRKFAPDGKQLFSVPIGQGTIGGLMATAEGDVFVAVAAGANQGVWRIDREGQKELLPGSNQIFFANGLAFDDVGTLWITESSQGPKPDPGLGGIWRILRGGSAELCLRDPLLTGTGALGNPFPIGANGIAYYHGDLYVTNTEKGTVLRMPVWPDGSIGALELWTTLKDVPGSPLYGTPLPVGGDGVALDVHGNLYVAVLTRSAVVRINLLDRSQETVAVWKGSSPVGPPPDAKLDFPASLFFGTGKGERTNLFVTNLGMGKTLPSPINLLPWVGSSLVKIDAGVPGRPLH